MSFTSTITNDFTGATSTLKIVSGSIIETLTYTDSTRSIHFPPHASFSLSAANFLNFSSCLDSFNANLIKTFGSNISNFSSFEVSKVSDINDGVGTLTFDFRKATHPIYLITASYPLGNLIFSARNTASDLTFEEWAYYHSASLHYELEIRRFFNL